MKIFNLAVIAFMLSSITISAQQIGNSTNLDISPHEIRPATLEPDGIHSLSINPFDLSLSSSVNLGSVGSPGSDLSFNLSLNYSPKIESSHGKPFVDGVPYGEGWSLNIPMISIEHGVLRAELEDCTLDLRPGDALNSYNGSYEEASSFWMSPSFSIPGVFSGRMVYKYTDSRGAVFVPNKFENYLEAVFNGRSWDVHTSNGFVYSFHKALTNYRNPENKRVFSDYKDTFGIYAPWNENELEEIDNTYSQDRRIAIYLGVWKNILYPQIETANWFCTSITDKNMKDRKVIFEYEAFGAFNYMAEFMQYNVGINSHLFFGVANRTDRAEDIKEGSVLDFTTYSDLLLKKVYSTISLIVSEKIELEYDHLATGNGNYGNDQLFYEQKDNAGFELLDNMYIKQTIFSQDMTNPSDALNWYRYRHKKAKVDLLDQVSLGVRTYNPFQDGMSGNYFKRQITDNSSNEYPEITGSGTRFSHSFLESPSISFSPIPKEKYEIITEVRNSNPMKQGGPTDDKERYGLFDINFSTLNTHENPGLVGEDNYNINRKTSIFSTFNKAIKWSTNKTTKLTSNIFVMPFRVNEQDNSTNFVLQIGPSNADIDYSRTRSEVEYYDGLNTQVSAANAYHYRTDQNESADVFGYSAWWKPIPNNFGIGVPWSLTQYLQVETPYDDHIQGPLWERDFFNFWFDEDPHANNPDNVPTALGHNTLLKSVKINRISKLPYMLSSVKKYISNGTSIVPVNATSDVYPCATTPEEPVSNIKLEYYREEVAYDYEGDDNDNISNVYLLKSVETIDLDDDTQSGGVIKFLYDNPLNTSLLSSAPELNGAGTDISFDKFYQGALVLSSISYPMGKEKEIVYKDYDGDILSTLNYGWTNSSCIIEGGYNLNNVNPRIYTLEVAKVIESKGKYNTVSAFGNSDKIVTEYNASSPSPRHSYLPIATVNNFRRGVGYTSTWGYGDVEILTYNLGDPNTKWKQINYYHTDHLKLGKLYSTEYFDESGELIERKDFTWESSLAYENGFHRPSWNHTNKNFDYEDYYYETGKNSDFEANLIGFDNGAGAELDEITYKYYVLNGLLINISNAASACNDPNEDPIFCDSEELYYSDYKDGLEEWVEEMIPVFETYYELVDFDNNTGWPVSFSYLNTEVNDLMAELTQLLDDSDYELYKELISINARYRSDASAEKSLKFNSTIISNGSRYLLSWYDDKEISIPESANELNSYFISLKDETNTVFEKHYSAITSSYSGNDEGRTGSNTTPLEISTKTEYEYYTANVDGESASDAYYELQGIDKSQHSNIRLKYEPSWQLYSKKSFVDGARLPGVETEERYYYAFDLLNRYDRYIKNWVAAKISDNWSLNDIISTASSNAVISNFGTGTASTDAYWEFHPDIKITLNGNDYDVKQIPLSYQSRYIGLRDLVYQVKTISQQDVNDEELVQSNYFIYDFNTSFTNTNILRDTILPETSDCPYNVLDDTFSCGEDLPEDEDGDWYDDLSQSYITINDENSSLVGAILDWKNINSNIETLNEFEIQHRASDTQDEFIYDIYRTSLFLRAIVNTADITPVEYFEDRKFFENDNGLMDFERINWTSFYTDFGQFVASGITNKYYKPLFPTDIFVSYRVHERNQFGLVTLDSDAEGLETSYEYGDYYRMHHGFENQSCEPYYEFVYENVGKPLKITVGASSACKNSTELSYDNRSNLIQITDPFNIKYQFEYDGFGRLIKTKKNDHLISSTEYSTYLNLNNDNTDYTSRANSNYIETKTFHNTEQDEVHTIRQYFDQIGKEISYIDFEIDIPKSLDNIPNNEIVNGVSVGGYTERDGFDRIVKSFLPVGYGNYNDETIPLSFNDVDSRSVELENSMRSRMLKSAETNRTLGGNWNTRNYFEIITGNEFESYLGLNTAIMNDMFGPSHIELRLFKETIVDPDGKEIISFKDGFGRVRATLAWDDESNQKIITRFNYDRNGNVKEVINPENQVSIYKYNHQNWLYERITPDNGVTKYMYNKLGYIVLEQDENLREGIDNPYYSGSKSSEYRYYEYDDNNRLIGQKRMIVDGDQVKTKNPQLMLYEDLEVSDFNIVNGTTDDYNYTFSNKSTLDWMAQVEVLKCSNSEVLTSIFSDRLAYNDHNVYDSYQSGGIYDVSAKSPYIFDLRYYNLNNEPPPPCGSYGDNYLLRRNLFVPEKVVGYGSDDLSSLGDQQHFYPHLNVEDYGEVGKGLVGSISCNQVGAVYSFAHDIDYLSDPNTPVYYNPVQIKHFKYTSQNYVNSEAQFFNPNEIEENDPGLVARINYYDYNLSGSVRTIDIDLGNDFVLDMQYHYVYDNRNRLKEVYCNLENDLSNGNLVASYTYDNAFGRIETVDHVARTSQTVSNRNVISSISFNYDLLNRLENISSDLYSENLFYDQYLLNGATINNYNGNVNAISHKYFNDQSVLHSSSGIGSSPIFDLSNGTVQTDFNFDYDNLNRLISSEGNIVDWKLNAGTMGYSSYEYDNIGNITELNRTINSSGTGYLQKSYRYGYNYLTGSNLLGGINISETTGGSNNLLTNRSYSYDSNGNLFSKGVNWMQFNSDQIGIEQIINGRANLPFSIVSATPGKGSTPYYNEIEYLYDQNDSRIFKMESRGQSVLNMDYYLISANGLNLGIYDMTDQEWEFYVNGANRVAKINLANIIPRDATIAHLADPNKVNKDDLVTDKLIRELQTATYPIDLAVIETDSIYVIRLDSLENILFFDPLFEYTMISEIHLDDERDILRVPGVTHDKVYIDVARLISDDQQELETPASVPSWGQEYSYTYLPMTVLPQLTFYENDHLGNTRLTYHYDYTNGGGIMPEGVFDYFPYGKLLRSWQIGDNEKYLSTQNERDEETTFDYRNARFYESDIGRFLSVDPLASSFSNWSPISYSACNPNIYSDPSGEDWFVNKKTGDVIHIPGIHNIENLTFFDLDIEVSDYQKFATDKEFIEASSNGNSPKNDEYSYKVYDVSSITDKLFDWGVFKTYSLFSIQEYSYSDFIAKDWEVFGAVETTSRMDVNVKDPRFTMGELFNEENINRGPELESYEYGFAYQILNMKGTHISLSENGSFPKIDKTGNFSSSGSNNTSSIILEEFMKKLFDYVTKK